MSENCDVAFSGSDLTVRAVFDSEVEQHEKLCIECRQYRPLNKFWPKRGTADSLSERCKDCILDASRKETQHRDARRELMRQLREHRGKQEGKPLAAKRKRCRKCGVLKAPDLYRKHALSKDGRCHVCKACTKQRAPRAMTPEQLIDSRERRLAINRASVAAYKSRNGEKIIAKGKVATAISSGRLKRPTLCQAKGCRTPHPDAHHYDYSRPLDVLWACDKHHRKIHRGEFVPLKRGLPQHLATAPETKTTSRRSNRRMAQRGASSTSAIKMI